MKTFKINLINSSKEKLKKQNDNLTNYFVNFFILEYFVYI
jgi:hypothetical protein